MTTINSYKHGTFSWVELATTDSDAAKKFYGSLFGWTFDDMPMGPDAFYTMCKLDGKTASALFKKGADMKDVPTHWGSYLTVDDVDATTAKAKANGGKVMKEPFDVMDVGRMSVIVDPTGAHFCLWQAKKHIGAQVKNENGALCWNEIFTTNVDAAGKFYVNTFGWKTKSVDMGPMGTYTLFNYADAGEKDPNVAGMMPMPPNMKGIPSHWLAYFQVADCDASTKKVTELGGKTIAPPMDIPGNIGRFSIVQDPQGAVFALFKTTHY